MEELMLCFFFLVLFCFSLFFNEQNKLMLLSGSKWNDKMFQLNILKSMLTLYDSYEDLNLLKV